MLSILLLTLGAVALIYQAMALAAVLVHMVRAWVRKARPLPAYTPAVSVLKPVTGVDDALEEALRSHLQLDYPAEYELLVGIRAEDTKARAFVERVFAEFPQREARVVKVSGQAPNAKVASLEELAKAARHPVMVVNDADIVVPKNYLRRVVAPLGGGRYALVTCLYRATAGSVGGMFEATGIATDFMPSALVAPLVGVREFGFGSTLAFRADDLKAVGGFAAVREYLADDYQLARRLTTDRGKAAMMSEVVVRTTLGSPTWREVWRHQVRWARTIRVSRGNGYAGLPVTHAGLWIAANLAVGNVGIAAALWLARAAMGAGAGFMVLRHWPALLAAPLLPLWDLWAFAVWLAGLAGRSVWWRGQKLKLERDGRITTP